MSIKYHTALKGKGKGDYEVKGVKPVYYFTLGDNKAFVLDISSEKVYRDGLDKRFSKVDIFYAELPWRKGYDIFIDKSGNKGARSYNYFLGSVSKIIESTPLPVVLACGKDASRFLPKPDQQVSSRLVHKSPCLLSVYRAEIVDYDNVISTVKELSKSYNHIGDFCCGYGFAGDIFYLAGKNFTLSDINPMCIGYIAGRYESERHK